MSTRPFLFLAGLICLSSAVAEKLPIAAALPDFAEIGPEEYRPLRRELRAYYPDECHEPMRDPAITNSFMAMYGEVEAWSKAHPGYDALDIRRESYRTIRRHFHPVLFRESPFYFEAGAAGGYAGRYVTPCNPGWIPYILCERFYKERNLVPDEAFRVKRMRSAHRFSYCCGPFVDRIHNTPPLHAVFTHGFGGLKRQVEEALKDCPAEDPLGRKELEVALEGFDAIHGIQLAFKRAAEERLARAGLSAAERRRLERIAESAARCPWEPPRTFFEGLNTMWFCREIFGYVEGLSCFALGRPDAWLVGFYRKELAAGTLTEGEARDLVRRFMIQAECHHDGLIPVDGTVDHEMETPLTLGGCDAAGEPVFNELTTMFLDEHLAMDLVFPKLHMRFSSKSPAAYLERIAALVLRGHCVFAMFNDDTNIGQFVRAGLPLERARDYQGVGCWEAGVDSATDAQLGNYTCATRIIEATVYGGKALEEAQVTVDPIDGCTSGDEVMATFVHNYVRYLRDLCADYTRYGRTFARVSPRPVYSMCLDGCLERRRDAFDGGLAYAPRYLTIGCIANMVDSACAIERVVFKDRFCTLKEYLEAVRANWQGERAQAIRNEVLKAPYWGDNSPESNRRMKELIDSVYEGLRGFRTDQGGEYVLSSVLYREFLYWGEKAAATPDGRYAGDRFSQGLAPSEYRCKAGITEVINALGSLDHSKLIASNANLMFDGTDLTPEILGAVFRVFATKKAHMLQPNCVSVETLLDAQAHPERHMDIIVKVCGFSARFVALSPRWQREVIERHRLR